MALCSCLRYGKNVLNFQFQLSVATRSASLLAFNQSEMKMLTTNSIGFIQNTSFSKIIRTLCSKTNDTSKGLIEEQSIEEEVTNSTNEMQDFDKSSTLNKQDLVFPDKKLTKKDMKRKSKYLTKIWKKENRDINNQNDPHSADSRVSSNLVDKRDVFGSLASSTHSSTPSTKYGISDLRNPNERMEELIPEDVEEKIDGRLKIPLTKLGRFDTDPYIYERRMIKAGKKGMVEEALRIFEHDMLIRDRVMPNDGTFSIIISILGRCGHVKKAFELFEKMQHMGLPLDQRIFTSLFNACSNAFDKNFGLKKASDLLTFLDENDIQPNMTVLKAGCKALGLCGDLPRAVGLMDRAAQTGRLDAEAFNHLLMAACSDRRGGFRRAMQILGKMQQRGVRPSIYTVNHLLRATRDCGLGDWEEVGGLLGTGPSQALQPFDVRTMRGALKAVSPSDLKPQKMKKPNKRQDKLDSEHNKTIQVYINDSKSTNEKDSERRSNYKRANPLMVDEEDSPNQAVIPSGRPDLSPAESRLVAVGEDQLRASAYRGLAAPGVSVQGLQEALEVTFTCLRDLRDPPRRLAVLGGGAWVLAVADKAGLELQPATCSLLLSCLPNTPEAELWLLLHMEARNIQPDIDLLNDIMARRNRRKEFDTLKEVVGVMAGVGLRPNMRTYCALARACVREEDAWRLMADMESAHVAPNTQVLNALLTASRLKFSYKKRILSVFEEHDVRPNHLTLKLVEERINSVKESVAHAERNEPDSYLLNVKFRESFRSFLLFYKEWLQRTQMDLPLDPWAPPQSHDQAAGGRR